LRASLEMLSGRACAILSNLSCHGAQLEGHNLPAVGKDVVLACSDIEIFGSVIWCESSRCGIRFDDPIGNEQLYRVRRTAEEALRLGIDADEEQAAADWASGLAR
jgi:hypothetical protein